MKVYRSGNLFKAAFINGPHHTFLAVEFSESASNTEFRTFENNQPIIDDNVKEPLKDAVDTFADTLPIGGRFHLKCLYVSEQDRPNSDAYIRLMEMIFRKAQNELIQNG